MFSCAATSNLAEAKKAGDDTEQAEEPEETVADKGYHSNAVLLALRLSGWRTYLVSVRYRPSLTAASGRGPVRARCSAGCAGAAADHGLLIQMAVAEALGKVRPILQRLELRLGEWVAVGEC